MKYPRLDINLDKIKNNVIEVNKICNKYKIEITGVTKGFLASPSIVQAYIDGGLKKIGDARIDNLKKIKDFDIEKWLIRLPLISQVEDIISYSDVSLNSEIDTIYALNTEALKQNKVHKIILMIDLGDLREGFVDKKNLVSVVNMINNLSNVVLYGIGTNLSCFSFVMPSKEKMEELNNIAKKLSINNLVISGGNSATINLMMEGEIPKGINNLRLGESLLFGKERSSYTFLKKTESDSFILSSEIVELKEKPSIPWGKIGVDSYGKSPKKPKDEGIIIRALLAVGKQDCDIETMKPIDSNVEILGVSSDYLIVHIKNNDINYKVGSIIKFELGYFSLMRAMTSNYVSKNYIR